VFLMSPWQRGVGADIVGRPRSIPVS